MAILKAPAQPVLTPVEQAATKAYFTVAAQTAPVGRSALDRLENLAPVCSPAPAGATPICVVGVGTQVANDEAKLCNRSTYPPEYAPLVVSALTSLAGACRTP